MVYLNGMVLEFSYLFSGTVLYYPEFEGAYITLYILHRLTLEYPRIVDYALLPFV